jgi:CheY-like chemotaxis protein
MSAPRRIIVVDDEANIRALLAQAMGPPDFEVHTFADGGAALVKLHEIQPDLIVCDVVMPGMDGRTFLKQVRRSRDLADVPFIFLSGTQDDVQVAQSLDVGADDFVDKPFHMGRLMAKIRATLRMAERRRQDALYGDVGSAGTLPLLKFCEDSRLTGRLTVSSETHRRWADFLGGELVKAGASADESDADPLDGLLGMESGAYRIEQRPLDPKAIKEAEASSTRVAAEPETRPPAAKGRRAGDVAGTSAVDTGETPAAGIPIPTGCIDRVDVRGQEITVETEGPNRPDFTVTTVVMRGGQVLRKIEGAWQHPLNRREDLALGRGQILRQHERVVAELSDLTAPVAAPPAGGVDASLLAWAVSFVAEQARHHLGAVMTVALLRKTHRAGSKDRPLLRSFRVSEDGRVSPDKESPSALPADAVAAVAGWIADFLRAAAEIVAKVGNVRVRAVTHMLEGELEKCGFYAALDKATA